MSKRPIGRPNTRWEDDVLEDIRRINVHNWKKVAQDRDSWNKTVEQARTLHRLLRFIRRRRLGRLGDMVVQLVEALRYKPLRLRVRFPMV